jgi:hypothetical protein
MDWLRSEDLKEEKMITTSAVTIPRQKVLCLLQISRDSVRTTGLCIRNRPRILLVWRGRMNLIAKLS